MARRALLSLFFSVVACMATAVPVAAATVLTFVPAATEVNCNEIVDVDVFVDGGAIDLRGFSIEVERDGALLELVDVLPGQLFVDAPCDPFLYWAPTSAERVRIDSAGLGCSVAGPGAIARLRLRGLADGVSPLRVTDAILRTSANLPITSTWSNGLVLVNCPVGAAHEAWGTLKGAFR